MTSAQTSSPTSSLTNGSIQYSDTTTLLDSFGKRVDPVYSQTLLTRVKTLLQTSENTGFPGTQPVNFETKHFDVLEREDYFVCEKSDGIRCLLFFVHSPKGPASFMLDRNQRWFFIPDIFFPVRGRDNEYLKDTLMDGELVVDNDENTKSLRFLIFDLMALNGLSITQRSFSTRLGVLQQDVIQPHKLSLRSQLDSTKTHPPFTLELKKMERSYGLHLVFEQISKLRHDSDGIIWTPVKCPYVPGRCDRLLKWKPPERITVDFKINAKWSKDHKPIYSLNVLSHLTYKFFDHFQPDSDRAFEWKDQPPDGRIAEFRYDPTWLMTIVEQGYAPTTRTGGWRFVRFRDDKDTANEESEVEQIIHSIQEGVSKEQLLGHMEHIRDAWKAREKGLPLPPSMAHSKNRTGERVSNGSMAYSTSASTLVSNQQSLLTPSPRSPVLPSSAMTSSFPEHQGNHYYDQDYNKSRQNSMDYGSAGRYNSTTRATNDSDTSVGMLDGSSKSQSHPHDQTRETKKNGTQSLPGSRRQSFEVSPKRNGNTKKEEDTERKRHKSLTELDRSHRQQLEARRQTHPRMNNTITDKDNTPMDYIRDTNTELSSANNNNTTSGAPSTKFAAAPTTSPMVSHSLSTVHEENVTPKSGENSARKQRASPHTENAVRQQKLDSERQNEDQSAKHPNGYQSVTTPILSEPRSKENGNSTAITPSSNQKYHQDLGIPLPRTATYPNTKYKDIGPLKKTAELVRQPQSYAKNGITGHSIDDNDRQGRLEESYTRYDPTRSSPPPSIPRLSHVTPNEHKVSSPSPSYSPSPSSPQHTSLNTKRASSQSIHSLLTSSIEPIPSPPLNKIKKELVSADQDRTLTSLDPRSQNLTTTISDQHQQQQHSKEKSDLRHRPVEQLYQQPHQQQHRKMSTHSPHQPANVGTKSSAAIHTFPIQFINFHADRSSVQDGSPSSQQKTIFIQGECHNDPSIDQRMTSTMHQPSNYPHPWQQTSTSEPTQPYNISNKHRKLQGTLHGSSTSSSPTSSPRRSTSGRQLDTWRVTKKPIQQTPTMISSQQQQNISPVRQDYVYEKSHPAQVHSPYNYPSQHQQQHPYPYSSYYTPPQPDHKQPYPHHQAYQQRIQSPNDNHPPSNPQQQPHQNPAYPHHLPQPTDHQPNDALQRKSSKAKLDFILN